jgi:hypothetical protein
MKAVQAHLKSAKRLDPQPLDLSKQEDLDFFLAQFRLAGATPDSDRELAEFVKKARAVHKKGVPDHGRVFLVNGARLASTENKVGPIHTLTSFQRLNLQGNKFGASALVSLPNQPQWCRQTLLITDERGNPQGPPDSLRQLLACENVQLYTEAQLDPDDKWANATLTFAWVDADGTPHSGKVEAAGSTIPTRIISTDPRDKTGERMIKFCFGRTGNDCDYQPAGSGPSNVLLPIAGSVQYSMPIVDPRTDKDAAVLITISRPQPQQGGGCTLYGKANEFFQHTALSADRKTLTWAAPQVTFGAIDPCMPHGSIVNYTMVTDLTLQGSTFNLPAYFGISSAAGTDVSDGHWLKLPETRIYYSCLADGSQVRMHDGSLKKVEDLEVGDRVVSDRGGTRLTVNSTYQGLESTLVRLLTRNGRELRLSEGHPVVTPGGVRLARDLTVGQAVMTEDGASALVAVDRVPYQGRVRNVSLGTDADGVALTHDNTTLFANGILVGDNEMQWYHGGPRPRVAGGIPAVMSDRARELLEQRRREASSQHPEG